MAVVSTNAGRAEPRVWLVHGDRDVASAHREALAPENDVEVFGDAPGVIERLLHGAVPDVLVVDWALPEVGGLGVCRAARARFEPERLPILLLARAEVLPRVEESGATDVLRVPYDVLELAARVRILARLKHLADARDVAEAEARSLRLSLRGLLERSPAHVVLLRGPEHVVEHASAALPLPLGSVGRRLVGAWPELVQQGGLEVVERVYRTGTASRIDDLVLRAAASPELRHYRVVVAPLTLGGEGAELVACFFVDVTAEFQEHARLQLDVSTAETQRRRLAAALADSEDMRRVLEAALDEAAIGVAIIDRDTRYRHINGVLAAINGVSIERTIGRAVGEVIPAMAPFVEPHIRRAFETGRRVVDRELVGLTRTEGGVRVWQASYFPLGAQGGVPTRVACLVVDVTESRRASLQEHAQVATERSRREQVEVERERARALLAAVPVPVVVFRGEALRIDFANAASFELLGRSSDELIGRTMANALPEAVARGVDERLRRVLRTGAIVRVPISMGILDAQSTAAARPSHSISVVYGPLLDERGGVDGVVVVGFDVTDLVLARECAESMLDETRSSEQRLRLAMSAGGIGIFDYWPRTGTLVCDPRMRELCDLPLEGPVSPDEVLASIVSDDGAPARDLRDRVFSTTPSPEGSAQLRIGRGGERWAALRWRSLVDAEGRATRVLGTAVDVTDSKRVELELAHVLERLFRVQSFTASLSTAFTMPDVVRRIAHEGRVVLGADLVTVALREDGGLRALTVDEQAGDESTSRGSTDALAGMEAVCKGTPQFLETAAEMDAADVALASFRKRHGLQSWVGLPLVAGDRVIGCLAYGAAQEQHFSVEKRVLAAAFASQCSVALERARLYALAERERTRAEEASRMKDLFLSSLSHELRTPLSAILGWLDVYRSVPAGDPRRDRALEVIERSAALQGRLIDELLDMSRIISGKMHLTVARIDLGALVEACVESARPNAERHHLNLAVAIPSSPVVVNGDAERLQQAIGNLLANAIKFTGERGHVRVALKANAGYAEVHVADDGEGIAPDVLPRVFDRFWQADNTQRREGLGLGLAIVRRIAELHGGNVSAASEGVGRGAELTLRVPLAPEPSRAAP